jgi:hypothetical protein
MSLEEISTGVTTMIRLALDVNHTRFFVGSAPGPLLDRYTESSRIFIGLSGVFTTALAM